jgi:hypothetical protein
MRMAWSVRFAAMKSRLLWTALRSRRCTLKRALQSESLPGAESFDLLDGGRWCRIRTGPLRRTPAVSGSLRDETAIAICKDAAARGYRRDASPPAIVQQTVRDPWLVSCRCYRA